MKFSIVIPTQDRPHLLEVVVEYAMQLKHSDFEVIVSDNSTTEKYLQLNRNAVLPYIDAPNFKIIYPPKVLSPPEHFEFALKAVSAGEYLIYLTDKMIILPHALSDAEHVMDSTNADILNWGYATYYLDDVRKPRGSGTLSMENVFLQRNSSIFNPKEALRFKASGQTPRNRQKTEDYVMGKIVFGCYRRSLIENILKKSGTLFGGATHDYSAMIQALALSKKSIILYRSYFIFFSLPSNQSLGSLTDIDSQAAKKYFKSFSNADVILSNLLVPGVYASQHNMVAHDYKKFLPVYGQEHSFDITNWLLAIYLDLVSDFKVWESKNEKENQLKLFFRFVEKFEKKDFFLRRLKENNRKKWLTKTLKKIYAGIPYALKKYLPAPKKKYDSLRTQFLIDAMRFIQEHDPVKAKSYQSTISVQS
jgi:hypothetical protein